MASHTPGGLGSLQGVTVTSATSAWAVGTSQSGGVTKSLILHWNGRRWRVQSSPNPTGSTNLWDVSASSRTNAWAVGYTNPAGCTCSTAAFHWNGRRWAVVATPNPPSSFLNALLGVDALSGSDVWAVGTTDWGSTLISRWNGKSWN